MRRNATIVIPSTDEKNRDKGKAFFLMEMPSAQAERWGMRAMAALLKSGMQIPEDAARAGLAGIASIGLNAFGGMDFEVAEPLLNEMMECVQIIPDPSNPTIKRVLSMPDDIEEVSTRLRLRMEVFALHTGFSLADIQSKWISAMQAAGSSTIPTSPPSSGQ